MPAPAKLDEDKIRVGKHEFRVTHPLSRMGIFGKM